MYETSTKVTSLKKSMRPALEGHCQYGSWGVAKGFFMVYCMYGRNRAKEIVYFKIVKMLLDEANDFSCATTDVLAFKMFYFTSLF